MTFSVAAAAAVVAAFAASLFRSGSPPEPPSHQIARRSPIEIRGDHRGVVAESRWGSVIVIRATGPFDDRGGNAESPRTVANDSEPTGGGKS